MDIGKPVDFIKAGSMYLNYLAQIRKEELAQGENIIEPVLIDKSAKISKNAKIGPNVIIGANCEVCDGSRIRNACIMEGTIIKQSAYVVDSLIGWKAKIGCWARVEGMTVLGEDVVIKDEMHINGAIILPHKGIGEIGRAHV